MQSLGLIETRGLVSAIEAADAAVKSAESVVSQIEYNVPGMVTVKLRGGVADVQAAVDAGASAARRVGEVISAHVIPRPHDDLNVIIDHKPENTMCGPDARGGETKSKSAAKSTKKSA